MNTQKIFAFVIFLLLNLVLSTFGFTETKNENIKPYSDIDSLYYKKAMQYAAEGQYKQAKEYLEEDLAINKFDYENNIALTILDNLQKGAINGEAALYFFKGIDAGLNHQLYEQEIAYLKKAIEINPNFVEALYNLGLIYAALGQKQEALHYSQKAIAINPNHPEASFSLAMIHLILNEYQKAIDYFKKTVEIKPDYVRAYASLGLIYLLMNQYRDAIQNYEKAIQTDPNNAACYFGLGAVYLQLDKCKDAKQEKFSESKGIISRER